MANKPIKKADSVKERTKTPDDSAATKTPDYELPPETPDLKTSDLATDETAQPRFATPTPDELQAAAAMSHDVHDLERYWGEKLSRRCIAVTSRSAALFAICACIPLQSQSEVLCAAYGEYAPIAGISHAGVIPVFVDMDSESLTISIEALKAAITRQTSAIYISHTFGLITDLDPIIDIAKAHNLVIIEDASEATGGYHYQGEQAGAAVNYGVIRVGDVYLITCINTRVEQRIRAFISLGVAFNPTIFNTLGYEFGVDPMRAALAYAMSSRIEDLTLAAHERAGILTSLLHDKLIPVKYHPQSVPAWTHFPIRMKNLVMKYGYVLSSHASHTHFSPSMRRWQFVLLPEQPVFGQYPFHGRMPVYHPGMYPGAESIMRDTLVFGTELITLRVQTPDYVRQWATAFADLADANKW